MRNLFDQYNQPENRLSHALAVCLNEDRAMLREFVQWIGVSCPATGSKLSVAEQSLPGDPPDTEEDSERRGLPDIVIHDGESWCIFIESKIQARLTTGQLIRHAKTLTKRGFDKITSVSLTKKHKHSLISKSEVRRFAGVVGRTWCGLYEWLGESGMRREWPERLRAYLRSAEVRLAREGYLTEGTLTMFDGFPFSEDQSYTYGEAKRLLKLAMDELRKNPQLKRLGVDPKHSGRGKITGTGGRSVWDYLALKDRPKNKQFTAFPHLTLGVRDDSLVASVTIPNSVILGVRKRMQNQNDESLSRLHAQILRRAKRLCKNGASIEAYAEQRHYLSQNTPAIHDAKVHFKLETSHRVGKSKVRPQPEWTELLMKLFKNKRANIQFGYEVKMPWGTPGLNRRVALNTIAEAWCAMEPLLKLLRGQ
ncbi:MAG: PD-(D/E)XK nuclease family protein [Planctomycetes bacterium]|nr:PD-(D/E)XK nuclease family protein [Planctomycetota bacterium]